MVTIEESKNEQIRFFNHLKAIYSDNVRFPLYIAELLNVGRSAAYGRIAGNIFLSTHELAVLNDKFKVPVKKKYFSNKNPKVGFEITAFGNSYSLLNWMTDILQLFENFAKDPDAHLYYMGSNLHLFYYYSTPNLAAFYIFWLHKYCLNDDSYDMKKFSIKKALELPEVKVAAKLWKVYQKISSTEIWTRYILITTLDKIKEMRRDNIFESEKDYITLSNDIIKVMNSLDRQAEHGHKLDDPKTKYNLYSLELKHESNMAIVKAHDTLHLFDLFNNRTVLMTLDADFCKAQLKDFELKLRKSKPLSTGNRQERHRIINEYKEELSKLLK